MGSRQNLGLISITSDLTLMATSFSLAFAIQNSVWGKDRTPRSALADRIGLRFTLVSSAAICAAELSLTAIAGGYPWRIGVALAVR
jgi:hypothetical protein